ncbi:MAG: HNH endonuclease, partial [Deltaproteobacteria bacterium]
MTQKKSQSDKKRLDQVMAEARMERERREKSYREQA